MRKKFNWSIFSALLLLLNLLNMGQTAPEARVTQVSEKVYLIEGLANAGNVAFLVAGAGVMVVDSGASPADGEAIIQKIRSVTDRPVRYVVLTHSHGDHVFGLQSFPSDTIVIGHSNCSRNMQRDDDEIKSALAELPARIAALKQTIARFGKRQRTAKMKEEENLKRLDDQYAFCCSLRLVRPQLTIDDGKLTIAMGGETAEIISPGPAHIDDNLIVHFPGQKVVHMGDTLFHRHHPLIDRQAGSDTDNWLALLREVQAWPFDKVIPGHGPLAGKEALAEQIRYLTDLRKALAAAIAKGMTIEQAKKTITLPAWKDLGFPGLLPAAIEAVYQEMTKK